MVTSLTHSVETLTQYWQLKGAFFELSLLSSMATWWWSPLELGNLSRFVTERAFTSDWSFIATNIAQKLALWYLWVAKLVFCLGKFWIRVQMMVLYSKKVNLVMELCYSTALLRHTKTAIANTFHSSPLSDLNSWQIEWRRSSIWGRKLSLSVLFGVNVAKLVNFGLHMSINFLLVKFPDDFLDFLMVLCTQIKGQANTSCSLLRISEQHWTCYT